MPEEFALFSKWERPYNLSDFLDDEFCQTEMGECVSLLDIFYRSV